MLQAVEGIYRNGGVELSEIPPDIQESCSDYISFLT